jgi:branched-chain amino acid transport system substrate-binding protein
VMIRNSRWLFGPVVCLALLAHPVLAQQATLGVAAPLSGPYETLGRQFLDGVRAGAPTLSITERDTPCTPEGGRDTALAFIAADITLATGFLCTPSAEAALPALTEAGVPVLVVGARSTRLTDVRRGQERQVWRLAPRPEGEAQALAAAIADLWPGQPFGIVEDGSVRARSLADELRAALALRGLEPALVDNYRPAEDRQFALVRRIGQSGLTRIVALGSVADTAIILRDAASLNIDLAVLGGENLIDEAGEPALPDGVRAIASKGFAVADADTAAPRREGYFLDGEAAGQIAASALAAGQAPGAALSGQTFDTVAGPVRFDPEGESDMPGYDVVEWQDGRFVVQPEG